MPKVSRKHDKAGQSLVHIKKNKLKNQKNQRRMIIRALHCARLGCEKDMSVNQVYPLLFSVSMELPRKT